LAAWFRKALIAASCLTLVGAADAQIAPPDPAATAQPAPAPPPPAPAVTDPAVLRQAVDAAQAGNMDEARGLEAQLANPVARKLVLWAMADAAPERLSFPEVQEARAELQGWPRALKREAGAEKQLQLQGLSPSQVIGWFKDSDPVSAEGAMALASAYEALGQRDRAGALIESFWREKTFEAEPQRQMLARFGAYLTTDDHIRRANMLLYGQQGPATRDMIDLLPPDWQTLARARMAYRSGDGGQADLLVEQLPPNLQDDPGLAFERARYLRRQRRDVGAALALVSSLPSSLPTEEAAEAVWPERKALVVAALQTGDYRTAYEAAAHNGLSDGSDLAEAEFYAGWIALTKLKDPSQADVHFSRLLHVGSSPITLARGYYWRGRANEALGDQIAAQEFYAQGARYPTTFYGLLAAEKAGLTQFAIGSDPVPTAEQRRRFDSRDMVQAARLLQLAGERDLFRTFMLNLDDLVPDAPEAVQLVDMALASGDQDLALRVVRGVAQRGIILPDRGYPLRTNVVWDPGDAEAPLVYGITRQESNFDPRVRSAVGARGMMQLMPTTAQLVARRIGVSYSSDSLYDADYNMRLGAAYLGRMVDNFSGSYILAAAAYNAGPGRIAGWVQACGDPRGGQTDAVDFIECIPFSETRNYVMRVMENMEVYRARLNGGRAPLTLSQDLKRGGYRAPAPASVVAQSDMPVDGAGTMAPVPD
jgi:soluble lytic murein transglycosylase